MSSTKLRIRQYGDTAIVTLLDSADFTVNGRNMGGEFRLTDVWARRDGIWQLVAFHSSKIKKVAEASLQEPVIPTCDLYL